MMRPVAVLVLLLLTATHPTGSAAAEDSSVSVQTANIGRLINWEFPVIQKNAQNVEH